MEFKVIEKTVGSLTINYEELKGELTNTMVLFDNIEMVDEVDTNVYQSIYKDFANGVELFQHIENGNKVCTYTNAKALRAFLNKVEKKIDERRKELKKEFLQPYETVEYQAKELIGIIKNVSTKLDEQVKASELAEKHKKLELIQELWKIKNFDLIQMQDIFDEKWLNKTFSMAQINEVMNEEIRKVKENLDLIDNLGYANEEKALIKAKYLLTLDLNKCLNEFKQEKEKTIVLNGGKKDVEIDKSDNIYSVESDKELVKEEQKEVYSMKILATPTQATRVIEFLEKIGVEVLE